MEKAVQKDILSILEEVTKALGVKDSLRLAEISDHTIHNASIFQDKDSVSIAVLIYALSKLIDRMSCIEPEVIGHLKAAKEKLSSDDFIGYDLEIKSVMDKISEIDRKLDLYIQHVINEAEIKKGSRIYEHGISLARTADILGITQWELMRYIGNTRIADRFAEETPVEERVAFARKLFFSQ